eukprot:1769280-Amphidinium_carterae.2
MDPARCFGEMHRHVPVRIPAPVTIATEFRIAVSSALNGVKCPYKARQPSRLSSLQQCFVRSNITLMLLWHSVFVVISVVVPPSHVWLKFRVKYLTVPVAA